jgi:autotransporter translocation and assembly factor TamB
VSRLRRAARIVVGFIVVVLVLFGIALVAIETGWAKNQIRELIVRQANQYLTATLEIGRLGGSLLRGIQLGDVRLARNGHPLIQIDEIALSYSIRELLQPGVVIRSIRLVRPRIVGAKQPGGRWDLGALVKRESREQERTGPQRPIEIQSIEIIDGHVTLRDPLDFGAAHVPTDFSSLNASFAFAYYPVRWQIRFNRISWVGAAPELTVNALTGIFGRGPTGWFFQNLRVETPRSAFTLGGTINNAATPTELDLQVRADRFAFQEWSGVLRGLRNIAVEAAFDTALKGPTSALATEIRLAGTGGTVNGRLTLDTSVPGWRGSGAVDVERLEMGRWLNRPDRPSDITGRVTFDLALELGRHFPRGSYTFDGAHAMYMNYEADTVRARGTITESAVLVTDAKARAYGADVTTANGSIGLDDPFPFRFAGTAAGLDLRLVPKSVPVPRVESTLTFNYDIAGQFSDAFVIGHAAFAESRFLGATIGAGTSGSLDTSQKPLRFAGEGDVDRMNLHRLGVGLEVGWLQDPRYQGTVAGHFHVEGAGTDRATLTLTAGGRLARAELFRGVLSNADVTLTIDRGTLRASYAGALSHVNPSIPFADPRFDASLTGSGRVEATVRDLLTAEATKLDDYDVAGALTLAGSTVHGVAIDRGVLESTLRQSTLAIGKLEASGPAVEGRGSGSLTLGDHSSVDFTYDVDRADLGQLQALTGLEVGGVVATKGRVVGPLDAARAVGDAMTTDLDAFDVHALTLNGAYDATVPLDGGEGAPPAHVRVNGRANFVSALGTEFEDASGTITYDASKLGFDLALAQAGGRRGQIVGSALIETPNRGETDITLSELTLTLGREPWRLAASETPARLKWTAAGLDVAPIAFIAAGGGDARIAVSGTWRNDGTGTLHIVASHVFLETLQNAFDRPGRYGGVLDADANVRGTRERPVVTGSFSISTGRVERVPFQQLTGRVEYIDRVAKIDVRLDQSPGVWLTAAGSLPMALFNSSLPEAPIDVDIKSSSIDLGLVEGVTALLRNVSGKLQLDVKATGTSRDPHFTGAVAIADAAFIVTDTGSRYKNGRAAVTLARDRIAVDALHIEDEAGQPLDVSGSLGTHELRVGDLEIDLTARKFEVLRNMFGRVNVDAALKFRGRFERPQVSGDIAIDSSELKADEILERTVFQPYATEPTDLTQVDAVAALNPWDRLQLDVALHVPNTLRLTGKNVQISQGTPLGLGDFNLRVLGDLYIYKDPAQPVSITGSLDRVSGTYAFQGRRFEVSETESSINFHGDLNPEVYVAVTRVISGVETRVSILGPLRKPELRLSSNPPLDAADILSLIVFNTSTNQLTATQQQNLVARAGTLAAGFLATPLISAIENEIGLDILSIETEGEFGGGPRVTIGQEIAPGLVAQFSRQFGPEPYDEATIEYYLSRILRLRATFSDAQSLEARSPFRRVERAGIDLMLFFSF